MRRPRLGRLLLQGAVVTIVLIEPLVAQSTPTLADRPPTYSHAAPLALATRSGEPISIDGHLDEPIWQRAKVLSNFTQLDPLEGQPGSELTEVRIVFDDEAIYFGAMLYDRNPVSTRLMRRDTGQGGGFDYLLVSLDTYHDHQTAYSFYINPSGSRRDAVVSGGGGGADATWDPVWDFSTRITDEGWIAEIRIPFSQLRFSRDSVQVWGIQLERRIHAKQEVAVFSFTPKLERGGIPRYAHLEGIEGIRPGRRLELLPYMGGRVEYREISAAAGVDFANPYRTGSDYFARAGIDLKYGITSNLTLVASVNPDFGQVEVDPAVINLTAFETRFEEKRPFFVEGAEIFRFGEGGPAGSSGRAPQLLYSRRIGRAPQGAVPSAIAYSDVPLASTILGAGKLTGKTGTGWSLGVLEAVTASETAKYLDRAGSAHSVSVEPLTNYLAGRARKELAGNTTRFGMIATAVHRRLNGDPLEDRLHNSAYSAGFDFAHEWASRSWRLSGLFTPSHVSGSPAAIERTQRSSARYFHRPDADHLDLQPSATALSGYYAMLDVAKQAGSYQAGLAFAAASPGLEVNDLGFQTAADRITVDYNFGYIQTRPGNTFRRWELRAGNDVAWNYGGDRVQTEINAFGNLTLMNYWGLGWRVAFNPATRNDRLTRGGPLTQDPGGYSGNFSVSSDNRKRIVGRTNYQWAFDDGDSWRQSANANLTYRPRDNWLISIGPNVTRSHTTAQYLGAVADSLARPTYGRRYLFGSIDQTTLGLETRVDVTFTPMLSFEMYVQPFLSSGDYGALKELRTPGRFDFVEYERDGGEVRRSPSGIYTVDPDGSGPAPSFNLPDPDFNVRSLLGNAVLRWEWRSGSTIFLVWQQRRSGRVVASDGGSTGERIGRFDLKGELGELIGTRPENIFLIKLNYWLNP